MMNPTILDGGMGQELIRRAGITPTRLWSAAVMIDQPDLVAQLHCEFIEAGAEVITLNSYSATPTRLNRENRSDLFAPLQAAAISAAQEAIERSRRCVRIAGCLPPLPGSYIPECRLAFETAQAEYRQIVDAQIDGVDLFICETVSSVEEAQIATRCAVESGKEVWTALTVDEQNGEILRSGEPLEEAAQVAVEEGASAILINCSPPEAVHASLQRIAGLNVRLGAYANGFTTIAPILETGTVAKLEARRNLDPQTYCEFAQSWADDGATILGGCCEIGPAHIKALTSHFRTSQVSSRANKADAGA